ncbi:MAG: RNA methyltransferase [Chloroflexi bacterium]|nr:RNA methyltransferase [Chloroflexota bacterium]
MVKLVQRGGIVEMFRRVATAKGRMQTGYFSIEGIRLHERALRANVLIENVLVGQDLLSNATTREKQVLQDLEDAGCVVTAVPPSLMTKLTNGRSLGALLGLIKTPPSPDLPTLLTQDQSPLLLVALNIVDPGNVGAMMRTAHAFGCTAMIATGASDPFHPKTVRTSMGSLFKLPVVQVADEVALLRDLEDMNVVRMGTAVSDGISLHKTNLQNRSVAVFMGNEYWGLPPSISECMDVQITIPMSSGIDSFSVNAAAAVILYEIRRS